MKTLELRGTFHRAPAPRSVPLRMGRLAYRPARKLPMLAQAPPSGDVIEDLDRTVPVVEWDRMEWTKDEAIATFNVVNLLKSIHEKVAYSAYAFREVIVDPRLTGALQSTPEGQDFISAANATGRWAEQLAKPNFLASLRNLQAALEVNILPQFGVGVVGTRPLFRGGKIESIEVNTQLPEREETLNFGDLATSPLASDVDALQVATRAAEDYSPALGSRLGNPPLPLLAVFIIKAAVVIGGALAIGYGVILPSIDKISEMLKPAYADPKLLAIIEEMRKTDPEKAAEMLKRLVETKQFWESAVDVAKWVAVGVGTLAAAWLLVKFVGLFESPTPSRRLAPAS